MTYSQPSPISPHCVCYRGGCSASIVHDAVGALCRLMARTITSKVTELLKLGIYTQTASKGFKVLLVHPCFYQANANVCYQTLLQMCANVTFNNESQGRNQNYLGNNVNLSL